MARTLWRYLLVAHTASDRGADRVQLFCLAQGVRPSQHVRHSETLVIEENARGLRSPAYEPGPYSTVHEGGVIQFVDWYVRTIEPRLAGEQRTPLSLAS